MTYVTLPLGETTPLHLDLISVIGTYLVLYTSISFIQKKFLEAKPSYQSMHIGLLHDLNHHRFMGAVCRIEGMVDMSDMDESHRKICKKEIEELKETFAYITEKYESLH
ncbi:MAG: hypothetical protein WBA23_07405 [Tunicatimonas sp.]|uniref:hypothetical protein n=1 Tax=Tunicatimonas sp. TaxID=1940096 RepID=UPI003C776263